MTDHPGSATPFHVVLADANVLYSRVLRDYLLYAATAELITVTWSDEILDEMARHLVANIPSFTEQSARRLIEKMNAAFPTALVNATSIDFARIADVPLPDEGDRHVVAAAPAAEATHICTNNTSDFPPALMQTVGLGVITPDDLLSHLFKHHEPQVLAVHQTVVERFSGTTETRTIEALRRAGASHISELLSKSLVQHNSRETLRTLQGSIDDPTMTEPEEIGSESTRDAIH